MRGALEVADVFRRHGPAYRAAHAGHLSLGQLRVMGAVEACRSAALGGHVEQCDGCGQVRVAYNSCRDRHCPKCQGLARAQWLADRQAELLPVEYFHLVFTVPSPIAEIAFQNNTVVYAILFRAAAGTVRIIAADPKHLGAEVGMLAVLHTWGQTLQRHPHIHAIVPGGGLTLDGERWVACRPGFFLPVKVLSRLFWRLFLEQLQDAFDAGHLDFFGALQPLAEPAAFRKHLAKQRALPWVVYAKRPFGGPGQVLNYLGRYTHRVAIANSRLVSLSDGQVSFRWKDYRRHDKLKVMTLTADEFIRRFLLHVLPKNFHRIRVYGYLANGQRAAKLALCRRLLAAPSPEPTPPPADYRERYQQLTGRSLDLCSCCGGRMVTLGRFSRAGGVKPLWDSS
ncbi:Transposase zinc-binding domain-containing protein [Rhizobiales bacterium GAS188]|nr:Transposase zinc-binding domain-containing protein [Rhizobiales bacterium GAS188]